MKNFLRKTVIAIIIGNLVIGLIGCNNPRSLAKQVYNLEEKIADLPNKNKNMREFMASMQKYNDELEILELKVKELKGSDAGIYQQEYAKLTKNRSHANTRWNIQPMTN